MGKEPMIGVPIGSLRFDKVGGLMPVVSVINGREREVNLAFFAEDETSDHQLLSGEHLRYPGFKIIWRNKTLFNDTSNYMTLLGDCDLDAVLVPDAVPDSSEVQFDPKKPIGTGDLGSLPWKYSLIAADGVPLLTTVITDYDFNPLGVAYSSQQSAAENFRQKSIRHGRDAEDILSCQVGVLTLRSRGRGIWPKGLKNPNKDKDAPLPDELEVSSGDYLVFDSMYASPNGKAILIRTHVPKGHGFCHERYGAADGAVEAYFNEKLAPTGALPYRSCFHKILVQDGAFPRD